MKTAIIKKVVAREILDSRGNPTVECEVHLESGSVRDGGGAFGRLHRRARSAGTARWRSQALSRKKACSRRWPTSPKCWPPRWWVATPLIQAGLDEAMIKADGTPNKGKAGANAILGVSMAAARAAAAEAGLPLYRYLGGPSARVLPVPLMNIVNGGAHADNSLDFQEFMIVPQGAPTFREALRAGAEVFHTLKKLLHDRKASTGVGDEGGFAPDLPGASTALAVISDAITKAGYQPGKDVALALDVAASELFDAKIKATPWKARTRTWMPWAWWPSIASCVPISPSCPSRTAWPRTIGMAG